MPNFVKYLLTVDDDTGEVAKVEHVGENGELSEVAEEDLKAGVKGASGIMLGGRPGPKPPPGGGQPGGGQPGGGGGNP